MSTVDTVTNPLLAGLAPVAVAPPCALVVYGASGNLARTKLLPALYQLALRREVPPALTIVGVSRSPYTEDEFRALVREARAPSSSPPTTEDDVWQRIIEGCHYVAGDYDDDETFKRLAATLAEPSVIQATDGNVVHYLAVPPASFPLVITSIGRHHLHRPPPRSRSFVRIVIEKPYGCDLKSALALDRRVRHVFDESQVYRIDHYLGKETVQNVLALRFANAIFEPIWDRRYVDSVQITVAESDGVGDRAAFYEQTGALRDIVQNHVMQVLALTLMEPPTALDADGVREEKAKVLGAADVVMPGGLATQLVRAQYSDGWLGGQHVPAYRQEPGVSPASSTETYVALKLCVDNWRWAGVPVYIRAGKRLPKRATEVVIQFREVPHRLFKPYSVGHFEPNALVLRIQPDEGASLYVGAKVPGRRFDVRSVAMDFLYGTEFGGGTVTAYERLLLDALVGDQTLFIRSDEVMRAWEIFDPVLTAWRDGTVPLSSYAAGTWGPEDADVLIANDGRRWHNP